MIRGGTDTVPVELACVVSLLVTILVGRVGPAFSVAVSGAVVSLSGVLLVLGDSVLIDMCPAGVVLFWAQTGVTERSPITAHIGTDIESPRFITFNLFNQVILVKPFS